MDQGDRKLFEDSVRRVTEARAGESIDAALAELGWLEALADDRETAIGLLFEQQGQANASSGALDDAIVTALGLEPTAATAVVLPVVGDRQAPGTVREGGITVRGLVGARLDSAETVVVVAERDEGGHVAVTVPVDALSWQPVTGLDPAFGFREARGTADSEVRSVRVPWDEAVGAGQRAVAYELVGVSQTMLRLAREHALQRVQFGRAIASFQAVRHRLADCVVAIEGAAAVAVAASADPSAESSAMAKAVAGSAALTVARHAQQVLAGIGFTTEHRFHRYLRRTMVLDQLLGPSHLYALELGKDILRRGQLPAMLPL